MSKKYGDYVKEFHEKCANESGEFLMSELDKFISGNAPWSK